MAEESSIRVDEKVVLVFVQSSQLGNAEHKDAYQTQTQNSIKAKSIGILCNSIPRKQLPTKAKPANNTHDQ